MTTLLVVDDNEQDRYLLQALLTGHGCDVMLAADGVEALRKARKTPPDIVITDILMPRMDGYNLCRQWKRDDKLREIPLVFYTATYTDPLDEQLALGMGAERFVVKPQEPERLLDILREIIEAHKDGHLTPARTPVLEEAVCLEEHNKALSRKLDDKLVEIEHSKMRLRCEMTEGQRARSKVAALAKFPGEDPFPVLRIDQYGTLQYANRASGPILTHEGLEVARVVPQTWRTWVNEAIAKGGDLEVELDCGERRFSLILTPIAESGYANVYGRDITRHNQAEHDLAASETRYRRLFESAKDGILILDGATGGIVDVNPYLVELLGFPREALLGCKLWELGLFKDVFASEEAFAELQDQEYIRYDDLPLETKDGCRVEVEFVSNVYLVDSKKVIQCNIRDITERKNLEGQLRQAQRMEAIGQLAGGVAHDFNNILQGIVGFSGMLLEALPEHDDTHGLAEEIARGAERAVALTRQLLAFSRRQVLEIEELNLSEVVGGMMKMIRRIIGETIEVEVKEDCLEVVNADRGQIEQVLLNLCINARDSMAHGGTLTIGINAAALDKDYCDAHPWAAPGRYAVLTVTDTGCGMDAKTQAQVFEPFFTTKEAGKGTGLGLATVYGIVRQHQGIIRVYSEVAKGTIFSVYLPSVEHGALPTKVKAVERARGGDETILVAEDDEPLRGLIARILQRAGYTILLTSDGQEAIDTFEAHADNIDLLLLDVVMPKMGGKAVYDTLHPRYPRLKFIFSSGYSNDTIRTTFMITDVVDLLQKPYAPDALLHKVRDILDRPHDMPARPDAFQISPSDALVSGD